jgi:hypothetical protein
LTTDLDAVAGRARAAGGTVVTLDGPLAVTREESES